MRPLHIVHLMASPFFGGPERQMLGLAQHLPSRFRSTFLSFAERGLSEAFLHRVRAAGFEGHALKNNFPHVGRAIAEVAAELTRLNADIVTTSGYKPDLIGWRAARRVGIPVVSVSHGWTGATWKVRLYEKLDRFALRYFDAVVCVSEAQRAKVLKAGVRPDKAVTIHNAVGGEAFLPAEAVYQQKLRRLFSEPEALATESCPPSLTLPAPKYIVGAAGRLSPEKGPDVFLDAATRVLRERSDVGFVLFGDGPMRGTLEESIRSRGVQDSFRLAGFHADVTKYLPWLDLAVMSSHTEGLPIALLETGAAGVPTVATAVGGIPEVIDDGVEGRLVPAGDAAGLANRMLEMLGDDARRRAMGEAARTRVRERFTFDRQVEKYETLIDSITSCRDAVAERGRFASKDNVRAPLARRG